MALQEEFEKQGNFLFKYRGVFPLLLLLLGMAVYIFSKASYINNLTAADAETYSFSHWYNWLCVGVGLLGLFVRAYTVGHTPANTSGRNTKRQVADELNSTGIYSLVRHPLYLGNFLMWVSLVMVTQDIWFIGIFSLIYWIYYERIMFAEEQFLRGKFGQVYLDWAEKIPPFIPKIGGFQKSKYPFSWKKVLKKEKNGLFALFILFFAFEQIGEYMVCGTFLQKSVLLYPTIGSAVLYFVLKFFKYKTYLLDEDNR